MPTAEDLQVRYLPVEEVVPAVRNPKGHADEAIVSSIRNFGFTEPILRDERTGRLVAGHGRLAALRRMEQRVKDGERLTGPGMLDSDPGSDPRMARPRGVQLDPQGRWLAPVVHGWRSRNDEEAEAYIVASNRLVELGGWDERTLAEMLTSVAESDPGLLELTGYNADDLDDLIKNVTDWGDSGSDEHDDAGEAGEGDEDEEEKARSDGSLLALADVSVDEPRHQVHRGEVWDVGPHVLFVLDPFTEWATYMPELQDEDDLLVWYPMPYAPLVERASTRKFVMVQPDLYFAGHILDKYEAIAGAGSVSRRK